MSLMRRSDIANGPASASSVLIIPKNALAPIAFSHNVMLLTRLLNIPFAPFERHSGLDSDQLSPNGIPVINRAGLTVAAEVGVTPAAYRVCRSSQLIDTIYLQQDSFDISVPLLFYV